MLFEIQLTNRLARRFSMKTTSLLLFILCAIAAVPKCWSQSKSDPIRDLQTQAIKTGRASWGYWGTNSGTYYDWCNHSNRLVPVYTYGIDLQSVKARNSVYRNEEALQRLYSRVPEGTLNRQADYFDQTDVYRLQRKALEDGKKNIILMIFDGMDWQTTRAAAIYRSGKVGYTEGRGIGLRFQDYRGVQTDFGFCVTSPHNDTTVVDINLQTVTTVGTPAGGYDSSLGGARPWDSPKDAGYLLGWNEQRYHIVTDSANAATAMTTGFKSFNGAVNVDINGKQLETIAHLAQSRYGRAVGVVTNVPISHATPAAAYAHNVSRLDYQDLARDLVGLPSISHPKTALPGMDVVLGAGWDETSQMDSEQGLNFKPGNNYLTEDDRQLLDSNRGGKYVIAERTPGKPGAEVIKDAVQEAANGKKRLLGRFGLKSGHLPCPTANGDYQPTDGVTPADVYSPQDIRENPTLAEMTQATLSLLSKDPDGFWLMVEAGDVDWASHDVNIDNTIGAILTGDEAFGTITAWIEQNQAWQDTAIIVTSDHGHGFVLTKPEVIRDAAASAR